VAELAKTHSFADKKRAFFLKRKRLKIRHGLRVKRVQGSVFIDQPLTI
jgi:hypothetical protein